MALRRKLSGSPVEVYKAWVNCCLAQIGDKRTVYDLAEDLKDGAVLCQLIKSTTGHDITQYHQIHDVPQVTQTVQYVIDYMKGKGIDVCCHAEDITSGKLKLILDILWLIILHFEIHSSNRAAYQRTVNLGKRFLLEWCCSEIPNRAIDPRGPFLDFLQDGVLLTKLITKYCPVEGINPTDLQVVEKDSFLKVLKVAEERLGIPSKILSSSGILDGNTFDEYAVIIYMAVLRKMISKVKGEESIKGGVKTEPSPSKPRNQPDSLQNYSPSKFPHNKTSLADASLSPTSLRNLVDQHTKSHAAIQALQERIQSVRQLASTPKLQKKLPEGLLKNMAPTLAEGISSPTTPDSVSSKTKESFPIGVIPTDHNDNYLAVNGDELFLQPPESGGSEELYTSVDKQFLELMLDAVQKGFMPPELATAKTWLNSDGTDVDLNDSVQVGNVGVPSSVAVTDGTNETEESMKNDDSMKVRKMGDDADIEDQGLVPLATIAEPMLVSEELTLANGPPNHIPEETSVESVKPTLPCDGTIPTAEETATRNGEAMQVVEESLETVTPMHVSNGPLLPNIGSTLPSDETMLIKDGDEPVPDSIPESAASTPNKKVQFLGLDTVFGGKASASDHPLDISISPVHVSHKEPKTVSNETGQLTIESSPKTTVTWATLDSPSRTARVSGNEHSFAKSLSGPADGLYRFETALYGKEGDETSDGDSDDPFMMYLNSIEQTALKFKLQVEQAKVDTLETLKVKLERAYEGTPLEEIPLKFQEKLQDTIAQIASDEVLKKYEALVSQDEEMSEEENQILECMRNELDSVACENFELHQQLELLKDYEKRYYDLKEKFDNLDDGMSTIRNEYERKNGESEFLSERVESLEKSIVNLRVEYNNEIKDLQDENLQLQRACFELENRNKILEDHLAAGEIESCESRAEEREDARDRFVANQEFEMLQLRLEESERQNKALRAAAQADQAMIQCVEDKKDELEKALVKAQDDHSNVLLELHEAQRQISSDRVKLSSYQEETDALRRENSLLKSSLDIAQNELDYHLEKRGEKNEPWKSNKRMIWREIRELEKILKDVHREKRNLEKKYVNFKQENDQLTGSLSLHSYSSAENSPEKEQVKDHSERGLKSKSWHSSTTLENSKAALGDDESFSSPPRKVKSWLEGLDPTNGVVKNEGQIHVNSKEKSPVLPERSPVNRLLSKPEASLASPKKEENGFCNELEELRHHVGSLEAEKAAIVKELSSLRFSRITR